jgi:cation transport ATPase
MTGDGINAAAALARRTRRIARQSVLAGMGMSLAAIGVAAAGLLPTRMGRAAARSH